MTLAWKSSWRGKECRIFRNKIIAGILKTSTWKAEAYGELNGHLLSFKPKGFWKTETQILDIEGKNELGKIEYYWWKSSAVITYERISYEWKFNSWKRTGWNVKGPEETAHFFKTSTWKNEGTIEYEHMPAPILLAALYVQGYFFRATAAATA